MYASDMYVYDMLETLCVFTISSYVLKKFVYFSNHQAEVGDPPRLKLLPHRMHVSFRRESRESVANLLFTLFIAHPSRCCFTVRSMRTKDTIPMHVA